MKQALTKTFKNILDHFRILEKALQCQNYVCRCLLKCTNQNYQNSVDHSSFVCRGVCGCICRGVFRHTGQNILKFILLLEQFGPYINSNNVQYYEKLHEVYYTDSKSHKTVCFFSLYYIHFQYNIHNSTKPLNLSFIINNLYFC